MCVLTCTVIIQYTCAHWIFCYSIVTVDIFYSRVQVLPQWLTKSMMCDVCTHMSMDMRMLVRVNCVYVLVLVLVVEGGAGCLSAAHRQLLRLLSAATTLYEHILLSSRERKTLPATLFPPSPYSLQPHVCQSRSSPTGSRLKHCAFLASRVAQGKPSQESKKGELEGVKWGWHMGRRNGSAFTLTVYLWSIKWASSLPKKHASLSLAFNQSVKQNFSLTYAVRQFVSICDLRE